jgi:hypothetical protein
MTMRGSWASNKANIKIAVERCGCNSGTSLIPRTTSIVWWLTLFASIIFAVATSIYLTDS